MNPMMLNPAAAVAAAAAAARHPVHTLIQCFFENKYFCEK